MIFENGVAGAEPPTGTRGGSPTLSPGTDAGRVCPKALHDAEPTKHTQPFTGERGLGIGIENLIYFIKSVLFLQADINMPLHNAETICGKGVFVYIGKRQAVYIRLNEGKYNISN